MTNYYKVLVHSSTADIEKRKGLQRNYISALTDEENYDDKLDKQKTAVTDKQREQQKKNRAALDASSKALANHDWYMQNKQWKKEYNAEYYQNNKDYWKRRLEQTSKAHKEAFDYTSATGDYKNQDTDVFRQNLSNLTSAEINYERAKKEYDDFMSRTQVASTPVSRFQLPERKSLIDRGVNVLHKVLTPILGVLAKLLS
jgi:signal recognition particle GTPase